MWYDEMICRVELLDLITISGTLVDREVVPILQFQIRRLSYAKSVISAIWNRILATIFGHIKLLLSQLHK